MSNPTASAPTVKVPGYHPEQPVGPGAEALEPRLARNERKLTCCGRRAARGSIILVLPHNPRLAYCPACCIEWGSLVPDEPAPPAAPAAGLPRNEVRPIAGTDVVAYRYQIIGTHLFVYEAWEPTDGAPGAGFAHGTIRSPLDFAEATGRETWWGQVATRRLPAGLDALPAWSDERFTAVRAYQAALGAEARAYIIRAFPEAAEGRDAGSGSIELVVRQPVSVPLAARREV